MASGQGMMPTAALACCVAALAVETMGNKPITRNRLELIIDQKLGDHRKRSFNIA